ncbi:hypothetical protein L1987_66694 [Smallanthus sonchifolius]|uniref:Uncharacterized protein n=1 Tax=Smallanthus sonchifolius TaxID=185202 RepID=A0ACB9BY68_9ASTR|nr:hypothetical protein L1987_66694 [Smallanthus sonchifolius]
MQSSTDASNNKLSFISDLNPAKDMWSMKTRIIKKWIQSFRMDLILIDEKGDKIPAGIRNHLVPLFDSQLQEDDVVILSKFGVGENKDKYRLLSHEYKINFYKCTCVQRVDGWQGVEYGFKLIPFSKILSGEASEFLSVDVCGSVVDTRTLDIFGQPPTEYKKMNFDLEDLEGNVLTCTFWNQYAQEMSDFVDKHPTGEHLMAVIQHGKIKSWKGKFSVQSDKFGTRLFLNQEINEINDLRKSLLLKQVQAGASSSQRVLSSQTVYPVRQDFVVDTPKKHVDKINDIEMEMSCVVVATIKIVQENYGWFYAACRNCQKKVMTKSEYLEKFDVVGEEILNLPPSALICPKCNTESTSITTKFKVQVRVQDETGSVSFVLFDSHVLKIVGITSSDIRERQVKAGDTTNLPHEISRLVDKKLAFKIDVSEYNLKNDYRVYTVLKICDDPAIISELQSFDDNADEDAFSVTADSSAVEAEIDSGTTPNGKRCVQVVDTQIVGDLSSTAKRIRKKPSKFET